MADFPLVRESFAQPIAQNGDDVANFAQEDFNALLELGFKTCRLVGDSRFWVNKIWDPGGGGNWVLWETEAADPTGTSYPDPYGSGFGACTGYRTAGFQRYRG